ncbi:MAG: hypothetical protein ABIJ42_01965 [Acidobacteriota bacterium]
MQKSLTKIFGILFLVVLAGLLIAHFVILRNVRAGFAEKETVFNSQVSDLKQQAEEKTAENRVLKTKLGIAGIRDDVISNNYGTAGDSAKKFRANLVEEGPKQPMYYAHGPQNIGTRVITQDLRKSLLSNLDDIFRVDSSPGSC